MELLTYFANAHREGERGLWLVVRLALDQGETPADVAAVLEVAVGTMYRKLREHGLTYGRGRLSGEPRKGSQ